LQNQSLTSEFKLGYCPALDGLRAISILLVLEHHAPWHIGRMDFLPGGFIGVDIFFVLSGFLITTLLVQEWNRSQAINFRSFYLRRALRLFPPLFLLIILTGLYAFLLPPAPGKPYVSLGGILAALFYSTNWVIALNHPVADHLGPLVITWSLAIEEQFYIFWPPLLYLALRFLRGHKRILISLTLVIVAISILRVGLTLTGVPASRLYYGTDTRADSLLIGCLLSLMLLWIGVPRGISSRRAIQVLAVSSILVLTYFEFTLKHTGRALYLGGFTIISVCVGVILLMIFCAPVKVLVMILNTAPLVWIGRISYGLYLWHWPVRTVVLKITPNGSLVAEVAYLSLTFLVASLSFYLLERPFLRLKKRFNAAPQNTRQLSRGQGA
jgi:peptidoglycan/LPS O-acetylase OafA/YrhL